MLPIAYYLLKVIICSGILYGYYWLLLRNKIFHKYNRFYLMASVVLSLLLPLIKINFWQQDTTQQAAVIKVLQAVSSSDEYMDNIIITAQSNSFDLENLYPFIYLLVSAILLVVFLHTLYVIAGLLKKYPRQTINKISFINTDAKSTPFSFFNYIFWNHNIDMESGTGSQIFKHELAHVEEKHTHDKIFINIVLIFFWCNPFYWLYRKELNMIHEFIADKKAVEDSDTSAFAAMILQATYPQHRFQLTNNFFYSPIKRRLLMLTKNKNPKVNYIGRIMVLPLLVIIFAAFTFKAKPINHYYHGKKLTIVIDAGHGGKDGGAKSADGNILEKDITLALAKTIKELNTNADIEIVLTKETDIFLTREQKAEFAKSHNAAMYISLHAGATATAAEKEYHLSDPLNDKSGLKILIGNDDAPNAAQSKILGSAILNEFSSNYELPVSQDLVKRALYTLQQASCPSVYIETGLVNNKKDVVYLQSTKGKETIAKNILNAIEKFAAANLQTTGAVFVNDIFSKGLPNNTIYVNTKYADTNYFKTAAYKTKALVIVDSKEIGNVGMDYVENSSLQYSSLVTYNPAEAQKIYGDKGKYGVLKLTIKEVLCITGDSIFVDEKNNSLKLSGNKTAFKGDLSNAMIYIEQKQATVAELNALEPNKISSVTIFKGEKLNDIMDAKGKTAVINVMLKPANLEEVVVTGYKTEKPVYVIDGTVKEHDFDPNIIATLDINKVNVLKDRMGIEKYGEKGRNGVIEITTKNRNAAEVTVSGYKRTAPLYVIDGVIKDKSFNLNAISPDDIDRVDVLKDKAAIDKYGESGKNGVVEIKTKNKDVIEVTVEDYKKTTPLYIINGKEFTKSEADKIAPERIEEVRIIKEATALQIYGDKGKNGVVIINLKPEQSPPYITKLTSYGDINNQGKKPYLEVDGKAYPGYTLVKYMKETGIEHFDEVKIYDKVEGPKKFGAKADDGAIIVTIKTGNSFKVFTKTEIDPSYPGGADEWRKYLQKNLNPAIPLQEGWKAGTYTVIVQFVVHDDGTVSDVSTTNYQGSKTAKHCIDLIKKSAAWLPAVQNGHKVNAYRKQPVTFVIQENSKPITANF